MNVVVQLPLLLLAGFGAWTAIQNGRGRGLVPIGLFIGYLYAVHLPVLAQARYSIPLVPFLAVMASVALSRGYVRIVETLRARRALSADG